MRRQFPAALRLVRQHGFTAPEKCMEIRLVHRITSMLSAGCQAQNGETAGWVDWVAAAMCQVVVTFKVKDLGCHLGVTSADLPTAHLSTSREVGLAEHIWIRVRVRPDNQVFWKPKRLWSHICVSCQIGTIPLAAMSSRLSVDAPAPGHGQETEATRPGNDSLPWKDPPCY